MSILSSLPRGTNVAQVEKERKQGNESGPEMDRWDSDDRPGHCRNPAGKEHSTSDHRYPALPLGSAGNGDYWEGQIGV